MKKIIATMAIAVSALALVFAAETKADLASVNKTQTAVQTERAKKARASRSLSKTTVDPITIQKAEALINTKRLLSTQLFTSNVVDQTGKTVEKNFVRYHFRQSGVEWDEVKERIDISGRVGPRRYSKLKLLYAAEQAGKAGQLKQMLSSRETPSGLTLWDLFNAAMYLREDDENLMAGLQMAVQSGLCTQEQLDAILEASLD